MLYKRYTFKLDNNSSYILSTYTIYKPIYIQYIYIKYIHIYTNVYTFRDIHN